MESLARSNAKRCLPLLKTVVSLVLRYLGLGVAQDAPPKAMVRPCSSWMGNITRS
jgi:hypothetical protein